MISDFYHLSCTVSNMEEALAFYCDILGMHKVRDRYLSGHVLQVMDGVPDPDAKVRAVNLSYGEKFELQLMEWHRKGRPMWPDASMLDMGFGHLAFYVENIEEMYEKMKAKGVKFHCDIQVSGKQVKSVSFAGPDGVRMEMLEPGPEWQAVSFEDYHHPEKK